MTPTAPAFLPKYEMYDMKEAGAGQEMGGGGPTWLEAGNKNNPTEASSRTAVAGEEIGVDFNIYNPLIQELHLTHLRACAEAPTPDSFQVPLPPTPGAWMGAVAISIHSRVAKSLTAKWQCRPLQSPQAAHRS